MTKFYTRTGDDGTTGLIGAGRVRKDSPRIEAIGAIDEANAILGVARSVCQSEICSNILLAIQRDLYRMMSEVAATPENALRFREIGPEKVSWLEENIKEIEGEVELPDEFIVPGDTFVGGILDLARSVVRRAERCVAGLYSDGALENQDLVRYLNRLSSFCFVLELLENKLSGPGEITLAKE